MSRTNYGSLGRRPSSGAWQWVVLGMILGFGCAVIFGLAGLVTGVISLDGTAAGGTTPTPVVMVITATPAPVTATLPPTEGLLVATSAEPAVVLPSPTPLSPTPNVLVEPSPTYTLPPSAAPAVPLVGDAAIPDVLRNLRTRTVSVAGGTFTMGTTAAEVNEAVRQCVDVDGGVCQLSYGEDSSPPHQVTVDPFQMEVFEVSYAQYIAFLNFMGPRSHLNGCDGQPCLATRNEVENSNITFDSANYDVPDVINSFPIVNVTWYGARSYCAAVGRRLPSEAEWERAARGANNTLYPWGNEWSYDLARTNRPIPEDASQAGALPVDSLPGGATPDGIFNMSGNVGEWVSDWYGSTFYTQQAQSPTAPLNPQGPPAGTEKVFRGGSWDATPFFARAVHRRSLEPNNQLPVLGFRCVADAETATVSGAAPAANTTTGTIPLLGTVDPATLGTSLEETTANGAPTLPAAPVAAATPTTLATLAPG